MEIVICDTFSDIKVLLLDLIQSPNDSSLLQVNILLICLSLVQCADEENFLDEILTKRTCICAELSIVPRAVNPANTYKIIWKNEHEK